uniref:Reverse transcriptase domain-containing protein n=1 Tax=Tanacetum cinerariifolium TaxID=118510 RepID=A0A699INV1_TANCI|nr:reverse transcriptase domain-containing protein [Tanacetum cinerariifolium]
MSQNPNEQEYFINLLNPNLSYQQENASNPSTPSSQNSISSSSYQQYPPFDTQYAIPQMTSKQVFPMAIISDPYHPQTSGQVEVSNPGLKRNLERTVGKNRASWAYWALKHVNFDLKTAGDHQKLQLNELSELRDQAYENSVIYKERTKKLHDFKIKNHIFNFGDQVLLFNSRLKIFSGKLKTHWSGPFTITQVFPYGNIELSQPNGPNFKVNGHRVKHYFGGDIPSNVVPDLYTFPMDN